MFMTILFDSPRFIITHDVSNQWLYMQWIGLQDAASSLVSCSLIVQYIKQTNCQKLFCDSSQAIDGWDEIGQWANELYFPHLHDLGICAVAWVNASDWVSMHSLDEMIRHSTRPFIVIFAEEASAYEWLRTIKSPSPLT